jgi:hypothetical protein
MSKGSWQDVPGGGETIIDDEDIIEIVDDDDLAKRANSESDLDGFKTPVPTGDDEENE